MKKIIVIVCFVYCSSVISLMAQKLELNISTSKSTYLFAEPIEIGISLRNTGNNTVKSMRPHPARGNLKIEIVGSDGKTVPYTGYISYWDNSEKNLELAPNEEILLLLESDEFYGRMFNENTPRRAIKPDDYNIKAFFQDEDINIASNKVSIRVVQPFGKELMVYNEYVNILNNLRFDSKQYSIELCSMILSLVEKNPTSVYAPLLLNQAASQYQIVLFDKNNTVIIYKKILDEYSESGQSQYFIKDVLDSIVDKSRQLEFLQKIKLKSKNSLMEKVIDKKISEIN